MYLFVCLLCVCACICMCMCAMAQVWMSEDNFQGFKVLGLPFHFVNPRDLTQVVRLVGKLVPLHANSSH